MPNTREKLIELLDSFNRDLSQYAGDSKYFMVDDNCELADHLIANGVTVQQWISVKERLPAENDADDNGFVFAYTAENKKIIALWTDVCRFSEFVTHWMPLTEPPKGE